MAIREGGRGAKLGKGGMQLHDSRWNSRLSAVAWVLLTVTGRALFELGEDRFETRCGLFIPNAVYQLGLATNVALWQLGHAAMGEERAVAQAQRSDDGADNGKALRSDALAGC
jgi:hypothetical protein